MSRADADMYAAACASGAVAATLGNIVSTFCGTGTGGELNEISGIAAADAYYNNDEIDEINIFAAYAGERVEDKRNNNWLSYFILAFPVMIAIVSVFVVVFRAV
ncbi:uncharacterized protein LOC112270220 [Brachypodium distachyon]|uniref:uncharacterized protein LOC112270220 n=1 Tax=Brachypodium distachyon TaxID=15368 RepID=UPI000D0D3667|nr:uncharacterized protein LOC112270220 [Brachypodium distachyon]|eukprot:XP_024313912.1 uncharacterized protein LOC112270220 [Brachypodium distachyon]